MLEPTDYLARFQPFIPFGGVLFDSMLFTNVSGQSKRYVSRIEEDCNFFFINALIPATNHVADGRKDI